MCPLHSTSTVVWCQGDGLCWCGTGATWLVWRVSSRKRARQCERWSRSCSETLWGHPTPTYKVITYWSHWERRNEIKPESELHMITLVRLPGSHSSGLLSGCQVQPAFRDERIPKQSSVPLDENLKKVALSDPASSLLLKVRCSE